MLGKKKTFYDIYHKKNRNGQYYSVITEPNFTYFYTLKYLKKVLSEFGLRQLNILDLGCGVGTIDFYLAKMGHHVTGVDVSPDAINICKTAQKQLEFDNTNFICADIANVPIHRKFDLIICSEVIEHVEDDDGLLAKMHPLLNDGGMLLLTTPSQKAPLYRLGLLKNFDRRVGHLRRYTMDSLTELVSSSGFEIVTSAKTESILRNMLYTFSILGYLIKFIRGPLVPIFHIVDQLFVTLLGESDLVVIGRKL